MASVLGSCQAIFDFNSMHQRHLHELSPQDVYLCSCGADQKDREQFLFSAERLASRVKRFGNEIEAGQGIGESGEENAVRLSSDGQTIQTSMR